MGHTNCCGSSTGGLIRSSVARVLPDLDVEAVVRRLDLVTPAGRDDERDGSGAFSGWAIPAAVLIPVELSMYFSISFSLFQLKYRKSRLAMSCCKYILKHLVIPSSEVGK